MPDNLARFARLAAASEQARTRRLQAEARAEREEWGRACADLPQRLAAWASDMTLGEATEILTGPGWGCACSGPPFWPAPPGTPCRCALTMARVRALRRAAHITANLMLRLRVARSTTPWPGD